MPTLLTKPKAKISQILDVIKVRGARVHNLKNLDVDIPKNKLVVITGVSGSGKSSLAFDTIYAEAERRYIESLSAYARQFLGVKDKPDVEKIEGLSPAIAIDQRSISRNPRSTVATITEIYDYLRILFARVGKPHCPQCGSPVGKQTPTQITDQVINLRKTAAGKTTMLLSPIVEGKKGEHKGLMEEILRAGFPYVRFDGIVWRTEELLDQAIDKKRKHTLEVVVDRLELDKSLERQRVAEGVEQALKMGKGNMKVAFSKEQMANSQSPATGHKPLAISDLLFSERFSCAKCGLNLPDIEPRLFSFNNPYGACNQCTGLGTLIRVDPELVIPNKNLTLAEGAIRPWMTASHRVGRQSWYWYQLSEFADKYRFSLNTPLKNLSKNAIDKILYGDDEFEGVIPNLERRWKETDSEFTRQEIEKYMVKVTCPLCKGKRLKQEALAVTIAGKNIADLTEMTIEGAREFFASYQPSHANERRISQSLVKEIAKRLDFMLQVGLDYLTLGRESTTLAGGEAQRIRLATQIGSGLSGVIYVLDEPSIGLHARDQWRLIQTLKNLRDLGNTVLVVEHDEQTIRAADWLIDIGPGAGEDGGKVVFEGAPARIEKAKTLTAEYLSGKKKVALPPKKNPGNGKYLELFGASEHNLKNITLKIPLGKFVCITGVSGSGKSTLITDTLGSALLRYFYQARIVPGKYKGIKGLEHVDKVVIVDQLPIGRTPRSNPATYTGAFGYIRELFTKTQISKMRGYGPGRFSFNVKGGRCEVCEGQGWRKIEMFFLPDVYVECEECHGTRYNKEALEVEYRGKNIAQVLEMSISNALKFFHNIPGLRAKLQTLEDVGLGYMKLGQPAPTLSGGEAQRVKLATELSRRGTGRTLYILDEPTTGLHFDDVRKLLGVLRALVDRGNTVLVIEHELHVIASCDWVIDLGPEGGDKGGEIIVEGTPREVRNNTKSYTGKFLALNIA